METEIEKPIKKESGTLTSKFQTSNEALIRTRLDSDLLTRTTRFDSNDYEEIFTNLSWNAVNKSSNSDHSATDVKRKNQPFYH